MLKHAFSTMSDYRTIFDPLPVSADAPLFFDRDAVVLPYSEDFPKLHYHDRYEIGICEDGEGLFLSEDVFSSISRGDLFFIAPERRHYSRSLNRDALCLCRFAYLNRAVVEGVISAATRGDPDKLHTVMIAQMTVPHVIHSEEHPDLAAMLREIMDTCRDDNPDSASLAALRLSAFLIEAQRQMKAVHVHSDSPHQSDDSVAMISEYLSLHYSGSETARELAAMCHLSESQLRRRFITVYGIPPIAYRNRLRNQIARELLVQTSLPVSMISERIGYTACSDFYRAFKKMYGISPSAYRARGEDRDERK